MQARGSTCHVCTLFQKPGSKFEKLEWDPSFKQAVYFLSPRDISRSLVKLEYSVQFSSSSGDIEMTFSGVN